MNVLLVIDHFGSGGAQIQMVTLACGLKKKGHNVEFFIYYPAFDFYKKEIDRLNIKIHFIKKNTQGFSLSVLLYLRRLLKTRHYNTVISFLDTPNIYTELASIGIRNLRVIVSERNSYINEKSKLKSFSTRLLHLLSDSVVSNSKSQTEWINKKYPWLKNKTKTIYNGYNPNGFIVKSVPKLNKQHLRLIGIGRIAYQKNQLNLIKALNLFNSKYGWCPTVNWVGNLSASAEPKYKGKVFDLLVKLPEIQERWTWLGERYDVPHLLSEHHALISPSYYEGLPNVICEALFSGKPVLSSNVCDNPVLVKDKVRGFLFNPKSPESIMESIESLVSLTSKEWLSMGKNSRLFAENNLSLDNMVSSYMTVFNSVLD